MDIRRIFPIAMGAVLLVIASTSVPAAALLHCNNKVCNPQDECTDQVNGPGTHCIKGTSCLWDFCDPMLE